MPDIRQMQLGQVVDFCISYNERQNEAEIKASKKSKPVKRKATQEEINTYFGR